MGDRIELRSGPAGGLYVLIPGTDERGSLVALLDTTGTPRHGWPVALDDAFCHLAGPAADGSIRVICASSSGPDSRVHALTLDGRPMAGWPVGLSGTLSPTAYVIGGDLHLMTQDSVNSIGVVAVTPDGTVANGPRVARPASNVGDSFAQLGPDGTGYLLAYPNVEDGVTEITAFDLRGPRTDWVARVAGRPYGLAFGRNGRVFVTEGLTGQRPSRILVLGRDGQPQPYGSGDLPVAPTSAYQGPGPFNGPPPPVIADGGTAFLVSEEGGTTVYRLEVNGEIAAGWPYRGAIGLQWNHMMPGDTGGSSRRSAPAVGPGDVLYLLHAPRSATVGGSIVAIDPDGRVRSGWPVGLRRPGSTFGSVVVAPDGTAYAVAIEPEPAGEFSATILAIAPDSTVRFSRTVVEPPPVSRPTPRPTPVIAAITAGDSHSCALTTDAEALCWGWNGAGQLGNGTQTSSSVPTDVGSLPPEVTSLSAGGHTCAVDRKGAVTCWGHNADGRLGDGTLVDSSFPVAVSGLTSGVASLEVGNTHTCAVMASGGVKCWGRNDFGQLGDGTTAGSLGPVDVQGLGSGVTSIAAGGGQTCALKADGVVACWGSNYAGQVGDGSQTDRSVPVEVSGIPSGVVAISTGIYHSCALDLSGGVRCWGALAAQQTPDGGLASTFALTPVQVPGLAVGVVVISAGGFHTCALTRDGKALCWGDNRHGQLGDGTTDLSTAPVAVQGLENDVASISAGASFTCALMRDGSVKCWGFNDAGALGNGSTIDSSVPVDVSIPE